MFNAFIPETNIPNEWCNDQGFYIRPKKTLNFVYEESFWFSITTLTLYHAYGKLFTGQFIIARSLRKCIYAFRTSIISLHKNKNICKQPRWKLWKSSKVNVNTTKSQKDSVTRKYIFIHSKTRLPETQMWYFINYVLLGSKKISHKQGFISLRNEINCSSKTTSVMDGLFFIAKYSCQKSQVRLTVLTLSN